MLIRILVLLWPFLKEMLLDDKTIPEAMSKNKLRLIVVFFIIGSVILNFFTVPRLVHISAEFVALKKKYESTPPVTANLAIVKKPVAVPPPRPAPVPTQPVLQSHPPVKRHRRRTKRQRPIADTSLYYRVEASFERIKHKEERTTSH